jgi:hypothetical protein
MKIEINLSSGEKIECRSLIAIPETALTDATYIRSFSIDSPVRSKHEFHALSQIALTQFDDEEIDVQKVAGEINLLSGTETFCLKSGMVICRLLSDALVIYINVDQPPRKYLAAAYRYCTRWVRLDI